MAVDIKKVQNRLLYIGVSVRDILDKYDIPYTLAFGTLLGAVRHQGFIPWDDDFDLYLFDDSYDYAMDKLRNELPLDLFLEDSQSEPLYFHGWSHVKDLHSYTECDEFPQDSVYSHHGISVDLYRAKKMKKSELCDFINKENKAYIERRKSKGLISEEDYNRRTESLKSNIAKGNLYPNDNTIVYSMIAMYKTKHMDERDLFPLKDYKFENEVFKGPANADAILKSIYGDYMTLPPIDKRKTHYSKVIFS